jgi:hypothetical protein
MMRWRFGDVAVRLLGGHTYPSPPPSWVCWVEPRPALPIDQKITARKQTNRAPLLRPKSELEAEGISCPYYLVRFAIAVAVDAAFDAANQQRGDMIDRWRVHETAAAEADAKLAVIVETLLKSEQRPTPRLPDVESAQLFADYRQVMEFHHSGALKRIVAHARRYREFYRYDRGGAAEVWRAVFVADLGFTWRKLTGANPTRGEAFVEFIAAAYHSIDADPPVVETWDQAIRRALDLRLDWQQRGNSFDQVRKIFGIF